MQKLLLIFIVFLSLKIDFVFESSKTLMKCHILALHCLQKYPLRGLQSTKVNLSEEGGNKK